VRDAGVFARTRRDVAQWRCDWLRAELKATPATRRDRNEIRAHTRFEVHAERFEHVRRRFRAGRSVAMLATRPPAAAMTTRWPWMWLRPLQAGIHQCPHCREPGPSERNRAGICCA